MKSEEAKCLKGTSHSKSLLQALIIIEQYITKSYGHVYTEILPRTRTYFKASH